MSSPCAPIREGVVVSSPLAQRAAWADLRLPPGLGVGPGGDVVLPYVFPSSQSSYRTAADGGAGGPGVGLGSFSRSTLLGGIESQPTSRLPWRMQCNAGQCSAK